MIDAAVALGTDVERLERLEARPGGGRRFRLATSGGAIEAGRLVVATGGFQVPRIPPAAAGLTDRVLQLHAHEYRNERSLPPGAILLVGTGQTGVQLAEEIHVADRRVFLSVGRCGRVPRRYRGRDAFHWLAAVRNHGHELGTGLPTVEQLRESARQAS